MRSLSAVRPLQENLFPLLISTLLLVSLLRRSSLGRVRTLQAPWQFKASSSALPPDPNVPQPQSESAPHSHPAGFLVDLVASRMEDPPQGFSAAEFEGEAQGSIVPDKDRDHALNFAHNLHSRQWTFFVSSLHFEHRFCQLMSNGIQLILCTLE